MAQDGGQGHIGERCPLALIRFRLVRTGEDKLQKATFQVRNNLQRPPRKWNPMFLLAFMRLAGIVQMALSDRIRPKSHRVPAGTTGGQDGKFQMPEPPCLVAPQVSA